MSRDIDVLHLGRDRVICAYELDGVIVDPGPASCLDTLIDRLGRSEPRALLLTHIHLDHAGAAGVLVRRRPRLQVHVSEIGAPHLVDPTKLERSARRLYGDSFDELWGELAPVPEESVNVVGETTLGLETFPTPGHARHHVSYLGSDGTLYAGDAAGVRIQPHEEVAPPTPPPDFDLETWQRTIDEIERRQPERLALIHFGVADDPGPHLEQLRRRLDEWASDVRPEEDWIARRTSEFPDVYERAMPFWQSYAGLSRYWDKTGVSATTSASR